MKPAAASLALGLAMGLVLAPPLCAEDLAPKPAPDDDGFSLMEEGAKLILRGMMDEMEPAFQEMDKALTEIKPMMQELAPRLKELVVLLGDLENFHPPEVLPNGDVLIRRKVPLVPKIGPQLPGPHGEIEL
ncbi:hypothetical protein LHP98_11570 [Rhodobacter sp. Har01]|uniref:hypothetical protein n=1 Tax=Rhodobacter sp. Har01 TaxID=2883999 RepID=UPI001D08E21C|nr:hypothetical protein [Rhodobacter sp. Har01]MCB6178767.1 hypothetical protein [Rhodobacter sp. Har01]